MGFPPPPSPCLTNGEVKQCAFFPLANRLEERRCRLSWRVFNWFPESIANRLRLCRLNILRSCTGLVILQLECLVPVPFCKVIPIWNCLSSAVRRSRLIGEDCSASMKKSISCYYKPYQGCKAVFVELLDWNLPQIEQTKIMSVVLFYCVLLHILQYSPSS